MRVAGDNGDSVLLCQCCNPEIINRNRPPCCSQSLPQRSVRLSRQFIELQYGIPARDVVDLLNILIQTCRSKCSEIQFSENWDRYENRVSSRYQLLNRQIAADESDYCVGIEQESTIHWVRSSRTLLRSLAASIQDRREVWFQRYEAFLFRVSHGKTAFEQTQLVFERNRQRELGHQLEAGPCKIGVRFES
jgi:hypothetical protein